MFKFYFLLILATALGIWLATHQPKTDTQWNPLYQHTTDTKKAGNGTETNFIRHFKYKNQGIQAANWERQLVLNEDVTSLDLIIVQNPKWSQGTRGALKFNFTNTNSLILTIDPRLEKEETWNPWLSWLNLYEIGYYLVHPNDFYTLEQDLFKNEVTTYPLNIVPETASAAWQKAAKAIEKNNEKPRMYHPLFNNRHSALANILEIVAEKQLDYHITLHHFPAGLAKWAKKQGLIEH